MAHGFWIALDGLRSGLGSTILYFARILEHLTWPQVFLAFLLLFPRQIKGLLITVNNLLEKMKTIRWGELKGDLEEVSEAVDIAAKSQERAQGNPEENAEVRVTSLRPSISTPNTSETAEGVENALEGYSRLLLDEAERDKRLSAMGGFRRMTQQSPIERFIVISKAIEDSLSKLHFLYGMDSSPSTNRSLSRMAGGLVQVGVLTDETFEGFVKYRQLRNRVVHARTDESEVIEAFMLGRRLYNLIGSIPLPEYRIIEPIIEVSPSSDMEDTLQDIHVVSALEQKLDRKAYFLTTEQFNHGMAFVPRAKFDHRLKGYFYFRAEGRVRKIYGQGFDFTVLYSRK